MDFILIHLIDGYIYLKYTNVFCTFESWIDPEDLPAFIKALMSVK